MNKELTIRSITLACLSMLLSGMPLKLHGAGTVNVCDEANLRAALAGGGTVTFAASGTIELASTLVITNATAIYATGFSVTLSGSNAVRVLRVESPAVLTLLNVVVADGLASGTNGTPTTAGGIGQGGGVLVNGGTLIASNCQFVANRAVGGTAGAGGFAFGGAVEIVAGTFTATNCGFYGNSADGGVGVGEQTFPIVPDTVGGHGFGGAIHAENSTVVVANCLFETNQVHGGMTDTDYYYPSAAAGGAFGGAVSLQGGSMKTTDCQFHRNSSFTPGMGPARQGDGADSQGGAVYNNGASLVITGSGFISNSVAGGPANYHNSSSGWGQGGAICNNGSMQLSESVFIANSATGGRNGDRGGNGEGGALCNFGIAAVARSSFYSNWVQGNFGNTYGIYQYASGESRGGAVANINSIKLMECTFSENRAEGVAAILSSGYGIPTSGFGGAVYNAGSCTMSNNTLVSNQAVGGEQFPYHPTTNGAPAFGGAVCNLGGDFVSVNNSFAGNEAQGGIGVASYDYGATYQTNYGINGGGAIFTTNGSVALINTILANGLYGSNCLGDVIDGGHNISSDGSCNFTNVGSLNNTDPLLGPLQDNGGPTYTMALLAGSPAIDAAASGPVLDQRGLVRPVGPAADIGAFEYAAVLPACSYTISPTNLYCDVMQNTRTIDILASYYCDWSASSQDGWLLLSQTNGTGSTTLTVTILTNATGSARQGTVTVAGQVITVNQMDVPCAYSLPSTSANYAASGGSSNLNVTAQIGCSWTATPNVIWISISSGSSGDGNGTVNYSVAANGTPFPRVGTVTIAGKTFAVNQAGAVCTYSLSSTNANHPDTDTSGSVNVSAMTGCPWTATTNVSWISITSGASGDGNGTVNYSVAANLSITPRSGTITIAGKTFTVDQAGAPCSYSLSPTSTNYPHGGGHGTVTVSSLNGCAWTAATNVNWIIITSSTNGSGSGTVDYLVALNVSPLPRSGTMTIAGKTFTINQSGAPCSYWLSSTNADYSEPGGVGSVTVLTVDDCDWTATNNVGWILITSGASGNGGGTVNYSVATFSSPGSRTGTMTIAGQIFTVHQTGAPCDYALSSTNANYPETGGTGSVDVATSISCSWTASNNVSWIIINSGASSNGNGTVTYSVLANGTPSARSGTITIADKTFTVDQAAALCVYTLSSTNANFPDTGGPGSVDVSTLNSCDWTATNDVSWITITSGSSGNGNGTVNYTVAANDTLAARSGNITIAGQTFTVDQDYDVPNLFALAAGNYDGLYFDTNEIDHASSGFIDATITSSGTFKARLISGSSKTSFSGQFSNNGSWSGSVPRRNLSALSVQLQLAVSEQMLTGELTDGNWTAELVANRAVYSNTNPAPQAGSYTIVFPGDDSTGGPAGHGYGTVKVDSKGNVKLSGKLGDGTSISQKTTVSAQGQWPLYASLYSGKGSILGWLTFSNQTSDDINGDVSWIKLPQPGAKYYPNGFTNETEAVGSTYGFTNGVPILNLSNSVPDGTGLYLPPGLVSWWQASDNTADAVDGNDGILMNGATFAAGIVGQAFKFDGIDDFVKVPQAPNLNVTNVTIEFWMKADADNLMTSYQGLVTSDFYGVEISNGYASGAVGVNFFISTDSGGSVSSASFPDTATANGGGAIVSAGQWHHIAATYDGTKLQLYIDGDPWGVPTLHSGPISPMYAASFVTIGGEDGRTTWPEFLGPRYFKGLIDEPSIYSRALSAAEVRAIYDNAAHVSPGEVTLTGGNLSQDLSNEIVMTMNKGTGSNQLSLTISPSTGLLKGSLIDPNGGGRITFRGAVLQKQNHALGYFLGTNQSGQMMLGPAAP